MEAIRSGTDNLQQEGMPFLSAVMRVEPQWIDYNGHLNMAYYNVLFDRAGDELWTTVGMGSEYLATRRNSTFTAECHVRYIKEIQLDDPVQVSILLLAADQKRLHTFRELRHATDGWLSATSENMTLHVNLDARKTTAFPQDIDTRVQALLRRHSSATRPDGIGRKIGTPSK
jgi:acyl-CoA thioester hydrolase